MALGLLAVARKTVEETQDECEKMRAEVWQVESTLQVERARAAEVESELSARVAALEAMNAAHVPDCDVEVKPAEVAELQARLEDARRGEKGSIDRLTGKEITSTRSLLQQNSLSAEEVQMALGQLQAGQVSSRSPSKHAHSYCAPCSTPRSASPRQHNSVVTPRSTSPFRSTSPVVQQASVEPSLSHTWPHVDPTSSPSSQARCGRTMTTTTTFHRAGSRRRNCNQEPQPIQYCVQVDTRSSCPSRGAVERAPSASSPRTVIRGTPQGGGGIAATLKRLVAGATGASVSIAASATSAQKNSAAVPVGSEVSRSRVRQARNTTPTTQIPQRHATPPQRSFNKLLLGSGLISSSATRRSPTPPASQRSQVLPSMSPSTLNAMVRLAC